jgi:hydroxyacylglutathione hydrolase
MIWKVLEDPDQGCLSYLLGDAASRTALVVDPLARVGPEAYALAAHEANVRIVRVVETHVHADHASAARALADGLGVPLALSHRAPARYPFAPARDGDEWRFGDVAVTVWETPGHTPDALSLIVTDHRRGPLPWAALTGDTLFVGDVGRPDLAEPDDAHLATAVAAQYASVRRLAALPDFTEVHPAHCGASACGGLLMESKAHSTIGYERRYNRLLAAADAAAFADLLLRLLRPAPPDAGRVRAHNLGHSAVPGASR